MRAERAYRDAGGSVEEFGDSIGDADLVVDALFGIGLARAPDAETAAQVAAINVASAPGLALDVPSGVDAATGHVPDAHAPAPRPERKSVVSGETGSLRVELGVRRILHKKTHQTVHLPDV